MAGLDLPAKLRRSLGGGQILGPDAVADRLRPYDQDGDGRLTKGELQSCLADAGLGGPWFCEMFAGSVWKKGQMAFEREVVSLAVPLLAQILHLAMARTERPTRRYVITPESVRGEAPRVDAANAPVDQPSEDVGRLGTAGRPSPSPRPAPARPAGSVPRAPKPRGPTPGPRAGSTSGPARPDPRRGPSRPSGRRGPGPSGPRRPSGRSRT